MKYLNKKLVLFTIILVLLIAIRIALPYWLKHRINSVLEGLENYTGYVEDINLQLWRGAYQAYGFHIDEDQGDFQRPFIKVNYIDLSIDWKSLFKGKIVSELEIDHASLNYILEEQKNITDSTDLVNWYETAKKMMPIKLNRIQITNSEIHYQDLAQTIPIDIYMKNLNGQALNLTNVIKKEEKFPCSYDFSASLGEQGSFSMNGEANLLKAIPDVNVNIELENVDLTEFNNAFKKYANFDVESGEFSNYVEFKMINGAHKGYVKPIFKNVEIIGKNSENGEPLLDKAYERLLELGKNIFENKKEDQVGAKIPFNGLVEQVDINTLKSSLSFLKNAFIKALDARIDHEITSSQ